MNAQAAPQAGPYEDLGRWIDAHHPEQIEFLVGDAGNGGATCRRGYGMAAGG